MATVPVKQFGEKRTGTNLVNRLLTMNYNVQMLINVFGWKHGPWRDPVTWLRRVRRGPFKREQLEVWAPQLKYVVCIKGPYPWVPSVMRFRERDGLNPHRDFPDWWRNRMEQYCELYEGWVWFQEVLGNDRVWFIRHEDLLVDAETTIEETATALGLERTSAQFKHEPRVCGMADDGREDMFKELFDPSYYTEQRYLDDMSSAVRKAVEAGTDWDLMEPFGYERRT